MTWSASRWRSLLPVVLLALAGCAGGEVQPPENGAESRPAEPVASVTPQQATVGAAVEVNASGFPADTRVEIGFGPPNSEYSVVATAQADARGVVKRTVHVPSWAEIGESYVWVVADTDHRPKAITSSFQVVSTVREIRRS